MFVIITFTFNGSGQVTVILNVKKPLPLEVVKIWSKTESIYNALYIVYYWLDLPIYQSYVIDDRLKQEGSFVRASLIFENYESYVRYDTLSVDRGKMLLLLLLKSNIASLIWYVVCIWCVFCC